MSRKQSELRERGFVLCGSAQEEESRLGPEPEPGSCSGGWAVVLVYLLLSLVRWVKQGKVGVCLNIYMQDYNWGYVLDLKDRPEIQVVSFSCSCLNRYLLNSHNILNLIVSRGTQASWVCIWFLCVLIRFFLFFLFHHRCSSTILDSRLDD